MKLILTQYIRLSVFNFCVKRHEEINSSKDTGVHLDVYFEILFMGRGESFFSITDYCHVRTTVKSETIVHNRIAIIGKPF